ncbi:hypothetical protein ACIRRH_29710 [Kitasatospora sp. NPDC101235]|uniref:hypothetical protein n=1 Tax=Kitasatospora sp. NPDC101235 TaxID=3364101 RepID=UPI00380BB534
MSDHEIVRAWKDPEADRSATGYPLGDPDLTAIFGGEQEITGLEDAGCGTLASYCVGCGSNSFVGLC